MTAFARQAAQSSGAAAQGTPGGIPAAGSVRPGRRVVNIGDEMYLWMLVIMEVIAMCALRHYFRHHHGG